MFVCFQTVKNELITLSFAHAPTHMHICIGEYEGNKNKNKKKRKQNKKNVYKKMYRDIHICQTINKVGDRD